MIEQDIKFYTIKLINGLNYLNSKQIVALQHIICCDLKIEKTEENFNIIYNGIKTYFKTINNLQIV